MRTPINPANDQHSVVKRVESMFRGGHALAIQLLFDMTNGGPVEIQFGDKVIHLEMRDDTADVS
jgi:hypothetical protein